MFLIFVVYLVLDVGEVEFCIKDNELFYILLVIGLCMFVCIFCFFFKKKIG